MAVEEEKVEGNQATAEPSEETVTTEGNQPKTEPTTEPEAPAKEYYSAEEMRELPFDQIDTTRIPAEMQPFYKAMQASYTKKTMDAASRAKETESKQLPPTTLEQAYFRDPQGVQNYLNTEIDKRETKIKELTTADPYDPKVLEVQQEIRWLERKKSSLRDQHDTVVKQQEEAVDNADREIRKTIPDIDTRRDSLNKFVMSNSDLTMEDIAYLTHPAVTGPLSVKITKFINSIYDKLGKHTLEKSKEKPPKVESPGTGIGKTKTNLEALLKKAQDDGSNEAWADYLKAKKGATV